MSAGHSSPMRPGSSSADIALNTEYKNIVEEPMEGFRVRLLNDDDFFDWEVVIFGPPDTLYMGGYFKAHMRFPPNYPYAPPSLRFQSQFWHPNVHEDGKLCISILDPSLDYDYHEFEEMVFARWNPTLTVRTIFMSVVSMLNEPSTLNPANARASVMYRRWKESKGEDKEYENIIKQQVALSKEDAKKDGVTVPLTIEEYIMKPKPVTEDLEELTDCYDDE